MALLQSAPKSDVDMLKKEQQENGEKGLFLLAAKGLS